MTIEALAKPTVTVSDFNCSGDAGGADADDAEVVAPKIIGAPVTLDWRG